MRIKLIFIFCFVCLYFRAQYTSTSPFSSYGLGERVSTDHAIFTGIGNNTITFFDSTVLNSFNPASYNTIAVGQPLFSLGLTSRISKYTQNQKSFTTSSAFIEHFVMAFRLKKRSGFAFGLQPFFRKGYHLSERIAAGNDSVLNSYIGSGGIHQVFIGFATNLIHYRNTHLSIGGNFSYLFGRSTNERRSQLIDANNKLGGIDMNTFKIASFYYDLGAYFKQNLGKNHQLLLSATSAPTQKIKVSQEYHLFYGMLGNPAYYDTISSTFLNGSITMPLTIAFGMNYIWWFQTQKHNNSIKNRELSMHFSYAKTEWSSFSGSFSQIVPGIITVKMAVGIQFTPERKFLENSIHSGFFSTMKYRIGCYQYTLPYSYSGQQAKDKGLSMGLGIPILAQQSLSSINLAMSYGKRNGELQNSLNEEYFGISLGLIIAPSFYERWFKKRKLD